VKKRAFGVFHRVSLYSVGTDSVPSMCLSKRGKTTKHVKEAKGVERRFCLFKYQPAILASRVWLRMVHLLEW